MALAVASGAFLWNRRDGTAPPALTSVAVLPFESSAQDPDIEYIADGLTDGLIDHLARAKSLKVQARATVMRLKGNPNPQEAARALGVGAVVTGALSRRGTQIVVSAELIHGATGERLWGQKFDRPLADLMRVQDTIVLSIAEGLQLRLSGEEKARLGGFGTDNPEAYELFLKGRFLMQRETEEDDLEALRLFKLAQKKTRTFSTRTWRSRAPTAGWSAAGSSRRARRGATPTRPSQRPSRSIRTTSACVWRWRAGDSLRSATGRPPSANIAP